MSKFDFEDIQEFSKEFIFRDQKYVVREASTKAAKAHRIRMAKLAKRGKGGKIEITDLQGVIEAEPALVADCVYLVQDDGTEKGLEKKDIDQFNSKLTGELFRLIKEVSGIDEGGSDDEEEIAKLEGND